MKRWGGRMPHAGEALDPTGYTANTRECEELHNSGGGFQSVYAPSRGI
jgi:hypothetical protein